MTCGLDHDTHMALAVTGLAVHGPAGLIVGSISFQLRRGAVTCLVGETGAGKSLVAQAMLGLLPAGLRAEGQLELANGSTFDLARPQSLQAAWGRDLFLLPQEPREALDPTARLLGQIADAVPRRSRPAKIQAALRRLAQFGIDPAAARRIPAALSGGMAQRGLLAIAAEVPAPVLIADEPTKGLDLPRRNQVVELLRLSCGQGRALLVVTHDLALAAALDGEMIVLHDGAIVERGRADAVLSAPEHPWTHRLLAAQPSHWPRRPSPPTHRKPVLEATGLTFGWPGQPKLFQDVSIALRPGEIVGVAGPSGAGKSTLCDVLIGLRTPDAGNVAWHGQPIADMTRRLRKTGQRRFQKLYQDPGASFPPHRRLGAVFADLATVTEDPLGRLAPLMERLRLRPDVLDRTVTGISGGEAQRLALARALLLRPAALIADEPTSRLDAITQADIAGLLRELAERDGLAVLLVSHDEALLAGLASSVTRLHEVDTTYQSNAAGSGWQEAAGLPAMEDSHVRKISAFPHALADPRDGADRLSRRR